MVGSVHPEQLLLGGRARVALFDPVVEGEQVAAHRRRQGAQAALMLGMAPPGVVQGGVGMQVEGGGWTVRHQPAAS